MFSYKLSYNPVFFKLIKGLIFLQNAKKWGVLVATSLTIFIANSNLTSVNLALPAIAHSLNANISIIPWVISSYIITSGMFMILGGRMGDMFGTKRIFVLSLVVWVISLFLAGCVQSLSMLILARILQGIAFAFSLPLCMVVVTKVFRGKQVGLAVSINITVLGLSQIVGPSLSGLLLQYLNWRWIFFINIPFILLALLIAIIFIEKDEVTDTKSALGIDYIGAVLLAMSLFSLMFILSMVQQHKLNFSLLVFLCLGLFILFGLLYYVEKKSKNPIMDFTLLFERSFLIVNLVRMLYQYAYFILLLIVPLYLLNILHMTPIKAGGMLLFLTVPFALFSPVVGKWSHKIGTEKLIAVSFFGIIFSFYLLSRWDQNPEKIYLMIPLVMAGISTALNFSCTTSIALSSAPHEKKGIASGIFFTNTLIAGAIGVSISTILVQLFSQRYIVKHVDTGFATLNNSASAFMYAFSNIMWMCVLMSLVGFFLSFFLIRNANNN